MARRKSLTGQLLQAYRDAQKAKAAELRRLEQERLREERAAAKREREQARQWEQAQREKKRQEAERARQAEQAVRELEKREAARRRAAEQKEKERHRQAAEAERLAKQKAIDQLRREAEDRTAQVEKQIGQLESILLNRPQGLRHHRLAVEEGLLSAGPDGLVSAVDASLAGSAYPVDLRGKWRTAFAPESRELLLEMDLPGQDVVPTVIGYRYKASAPPKVVPQPRKEPEIKELYRLLIARLALRAIDETYAVTPPSLVDAIAFNGHVQTKDRATGKAIRPCLVSVISSRDEFEDLVLDEPTLDPVACLRHLNAIVSQHRTTLKPYVRWLPSTWTSTSSRLRSTLLPDSIAAPTW